MLTWGGQWVDTTGDAPEGHLASKLVWLRKRKKRKGILDLLGWAGTKLVFKINSFLHLMKKAQSHGL